MKEKWFYIMLGLMAGIILMLIMGRLPDKSVYALDPANLDSANANGDIVLTTNTSGTSKPATILWVFDTNK